MKQSSSKAIEILTKSVVEPYVDATGHFWFFKGLLHRENGPAVEFSDGSKEWYLNGELHRTDGPAREYVNGDKYWWLNGISMNFQEWKQKVRKYYDTEEDYLLMLLKL